MIFGGIQKCSTIDYPGKLSCVIFTVGCDLNCFYCHNRALLKSGGPCLCEEEVKEFLFKRQGLLDGVVLSGGEPLLQDDLREFICYLRSLGYSVKLDTNGQHPESLKSLLDEKLLDYVAVDYKAAEKDYFWVTGNKHGYHKAQHTIAPLQEYNVLFEVRTTMYPGLSEEGLVSLLSSLPPVKQYRLNFFNMPIEQRSEDAFNLRQKHIAEQELEALKGRLLEAQPGLIY